MGSCFSHFSWNSWIICETAKQGILVSLLRSYEKKEMFPRMKRIIKIEQCY